MSHDSVIAGLKAMLKQDFFDFDMKEQAQHMMGESDRATIILLAAMVEYMIYRSLKARMRSLNSDELATIFNFEGPCGSFSNRIRLAHGLGIIDRAARKRIEIVKELRNTAAHSFAEMRFDLPAIHAAVAQIFPPNVRDEIMGWDADKVRAAFSSYCMFQSRALARGQQFDVVAFFTLVREERPRPRPWRDTPPGA